MSSLIINGPKYLCNSGVYSIDNLPQGASIQWNVEGAGSIVSPSNNSVTLSATSEGTSKLKASITSSCGNFILESDEIRIGVPYSISVTELYCEDGCGGTQSDGTIMLCTDPNQYSFYNNIFKYDIGATPAFPVEINYYPQNQNGIFYQNKLNTSSRTGYIYLPKEMPTGFYNLEVWLSGTECVDPMWEEGFVATSCSASSSMIIYPNPSINELKIAYRDIDISNKTSNTGRIPEERQFSVKLFNNKGKLLRDGRTNALDKEIVLQVSDLPNGTYFLHILEGKKTTMKEVIVHH